MKLNKILMLVNWDVHPMKNYDDQRQNPNVIVPNGKFQKLTRMTKANIRSTMQYLSENLDVAKRMGKKAMRSVKNKFTDCSMTEKAKDETWRKKSLLPKIDSSLASQISPDRKKVLLVGFGFYLHRISGDKNFWLGLSRELANRLDKLVIVSVNSSPAKFEQEGNIYLYNVQRPFHRKKDDENILKFQFQRHPLPWEILERSATLLKLIPLLKKLIGLHHIKVIHLMDNFGFLTRLIKIAFPGLEVYATAITYNKNGLPPRLYSFYQRMIFGNLDKVVVSSNAFKTKLIEDGFSKEKVEVIRWGISMVNETNKLFDKRGMKEDGKKDPSAKVILWTGFTQQVGVKSLQLSLSLARSIIRKKCSVDFIFTIKPECFPKDWRPFEKEHLRVLATTPQEFLKLLERADLLLAPIDNHRSIVAPPLTWIECMAQGIPIMSTQVPGIDEILKHNLTGFVAKSNDGLQDLMERVLEKEDLLAEVSAKVKELVVEKYNLKNIAQDYLKLWEEKW